MNNRLINTKVAGGGGGCTDIVDNYDPFGGNGVALYQLNGNANDVSGNYNGTPTNVTYGTGVFGQAGVFNGSSKIQTPINTTNFVSNLNDRTVDFSISLWINPSVIPASGEDLVFYIGNYNVYSPQYHTIQLQLKDGSLRFSIYEGVTEHIISTSSLSVGNWYNVVCIRESAVMKLYINNSFIGQTTQTNNSSISASATLQFGDVYSAGAYYNGLLDQVRFFTRALTPLEVEALYTEELCICDGTVDTLDILGDGSCIATYQLDGNANDLSGNYSGTPTNVSYGVGEFDLSSVGQSNSSIILNNLPNRLLVNSVSFWFNRQSNESGYKACFTNRKGLHTVLGFQDNLFVAKTFDGSTELISTGYTNNIGQWYHACLVSNNASKSLYINGSLFTSYSKSDYNNTSSTPVVSLYNYLTLGGSSTAKLDQVRIFNKALNSTEVTTLYNETACTKAACTGTTNTLDILGDGSCVATYPLDGSPADLSGNYNGVQGGNVTYPIGEFDLAASFGGSGKGIDLPSNVPVAGQINCSVSLWFNVLNNTKKETLVRFANNDEVLLRINTNGTLDLLGVRQSNSTYISYTTAGSYDNGVWHYLVMTRESGSIKFYIDNVLDNTLSWNNTFITAANETAIGYDGFASASVLSGQIDQVRIFNKALSAGEVTTLYNETPCN